MWSWIYHVKCKSRFLCILICKILKTSSHIKCFPLLFTTSHKTTSKPSIKQTECREEHGSQWGKKRICKIQDFHRTKYSSLSLEEGYCCFWAHNVLIFWGELTTSKMLTPTITRTSKYGHAIHIVLICIICLLQLLFISLKQSHL